MTAPAGEIREALLKTRHCIGQKCGPERRAAADCIASLLAERDASDRARVEAERERDEARAALGRIIEGAPAKEPDPAWEPGFGYVSQDPHDNYGSGKEAMHWNLAEIARSALTTSTDPSTPPSASGAQIVER